MGNVGDELGEPHTDQTDDNGTGGGDLGDHPGFFGGDGVAGIAGGDLRGNGGLKDAVKTDLQQSVEDDVHVIQVLELTVEGGIGQGNGVFVIFDLLQ